MTTTPRDTKEIDRFIGQKIITRREQLNMSQAALAKPLGVSFQQIQKNEQAKNRVPAARLFQMAKVLDVPVTYFFPVDPASVEQAA